VIPLEDIKMVTVTILNRIKKSVETHLKSGDLELVVLPRTEYETLLEQLDDLKDISDSIETLKEFQSGKSIPFDRYDARAITKVDRRKERTYKHF